MFKTLVNRIDRGNDHVSDIASYRLPPAGFVSILHRTGGASLLMLLILWMSESNVSSKSSFAGLRGTFTADAGFLPGWFVELTARAFSAAYLDHFIAGWRRLRIEVSHSASKEQGGTRRCSRSSPARCCAF